MKKILSLALAFMLIITGVLSVYSSRASAFNSNLIIDDTIFNDVNSMSAAQIDNWLNTYFPNGCISPVSGFQAKVPNGYSPSGGFTYGAFGTAGQVIAASAQVYGLNPQVLLVTLQKEQSLVAGGSGYCNNGDEHKYAAATGYGCPDSGGTYNWSGISLYMRNGVEHTVTGTTCVNSASKAGFSQQIIRAAWLLKFGQQRSLGNTGWAVITGSWDNSDDPPTCYSGPMTEGTFKRCQNGAATFYDGYTTIDGSATHLDTGATAALYWYTPHFNGNKNFVSIFESWFGSTISALYYACRNASNLSGLTSGRKIVANRIAGKSDNLSLVFLNNSGSSCIESHTWGANQQAWIGNIATNHPAVDPADNEIISADTNGDGKDELLLVKYRGGESGKIEIHTWNPGYQSWMSNIATNHPAVDPADNTILAANTITDSDNKDKLILVKYRNTQSGKIEAHTWAANQQTWYSNIATNHPAVDPAYNGVIAASTVGDGKDRLTLVKYSNSVSGRVEIHTWNPGYRSWMSNIATNHPSITW